MSRIPVKTGIRSRIWRVAEVIVPRFVPIEGVPHEQQTDRYPVPRAASWLDADAPIFPVSSQAIYESLRRCGQTIGMAGLTVHTLRHTAVKKWRQSEASLEGTKDRQRHG